MHGALIEILVFSLGSPIKCLTNISKIITHALVITLLFQHLRKGKKIEGFPSLLK